MDPRVFSAFPPPAWEPASCQRCGAWVGMLLDAVSEWRQGAGGRRDVPLLAPSPYLTHWGLAGGGLDVSPRSISESGGAEAILLQMKLQRHAESRKDSSRTPPPSSQPCAPTSQSVWSYILMNGIRFWEQNGQARIPCWA